MILALVIVIWLASFYLASGMMYSDFSYQDRRFTVFSNNENMGAACLLGFLFSLLGPLGVLLAFFLTGFAEKGIWKNWSENKHVG